MKISNVLFAMLLISIIPLESAISKPRTISLENLRDKVRGGWVGQMIGVSYGAPTEFAYLERMVPEDELPSWKPQMIREALNQDDLYVDITFAAALDQHGLDATTGRLCCDVS